MFFKKRFSFISSSHSHMILFPWIPSVSHLCVFVTCFHLCENRGFCYRKVLLQKILIKILQKVIQVILAYRVIVDILSSVDSCMNNKKFLMNTILTDTHEVTQHSHFGS